MDFIKIKPSTLKGKVVVPPSKSLSHRAIICAALSQGESLLHNIVLSEDIQATIEGMHKLGAKISVSGNNIYISRSNIIEENPLIDCKESGSTLRFIIPLALVLSNDCCLTGSEKLFQRPLDVYYDIFKKQNIKYNLNNFNLLYLRGRLSPGEFEISGNISSQFISGLLFSLPLLKGDSVIRIKGSFESKAYVLLTIDVLNHFGIHIDYKDESTFHISGRQNYKNSEYFIESDYSQAAFFLVANELGNEIDCLGLNENSKQGDKEIINIINLFKNSNNEIIIDASQIPDLVPIIAVLASLKDNCTTTITKSQRLRIKESDRLLAISTEMNKLGAKIKETKDGLIISGKKYLNGGTRVNSWNDHRIAMSLAIAATRCENDIILEDYMAVKKSYPHFWNDYKKLGGVVYEFYDRQ